MSGSGASWLGNVLSTQGTVGNEAVRQAASAAFIFNLVLVFIALASILITVPKGRKYNDD